MLVDTPVPTTASGPTRARKNMAYIPAGIFWMGSDDFYPEERPVHQVAVAGLRHEHLEPGRGQPVGKALVPPRMFGHPVRDEHDRARGIIG